MQTYHEYTTPEGAAFDPHAVLTACMEHDPAAVLLDDGALPAEFFDLSSGVAGALVQRLQLYGIRMAAVVPDPSPHSRSFQDFAREANRGSQFRFVPSRGEAVHWLQSH